MYNIITYLKNKGLKMKTRKELESSIYNILYDNMSSCCYSEVNSELINELIYCIENDGSVWGVLNDNLSNVAVDELEYETDGLKELNQLKDIFKNKID